MKTRNTLADKPNDKLLGFKLLKLKLKLIGKEYQLFIKEHTCRKRNKKRPRGRTMYILNIPPWLTEKPLVKKTFEKVIGTDAIDSITFEPSEPGCGFKSAHIVFTDASALAKALALNVLGPVDTPDDPLIIGLKKWAMEYNEKLREGESLRQHIKEQRRIHALEKRILLEQEKAVENQEGEDGWTVVTKKGRNPGLARKESVEDKLQEKARKKKTKPQNFYKHQIRASKQKAINEMREKFEKEKQRAAKMKDIKGNRKFKPY